MDDFRAAYGWPRLPVEHRQRKYLWPGEAEVIAALVASTDPKNVVEIGINDGRTAAMLLSQIPGIKRYIGVDVTTDYQPSLQQQRRELVNQPGRMVPEEHRAKLSLMVMPRGSFDAAPLLQLMGKIFDAVFIDGDHGVEAVRHDTALALSIVRPGGVIIWHDYGVVGTQVASVLKQMPGWGHDVKHVDGTHIAYLKAD